jgi:predicted nucleic acid-binding protein
MRPRTWFEWIVIADTGTTKVIDTSAFVAITFDEPDAVSVVARLGDAELVAPRLFEFELANVCLRKMRQNPAQRETLLAAYRGRHRLPVEAMDVDHLAVLALAERSGLSSYDACYLWLAQSIGAELVTLDHKLDAAARRMQ